MARHEVICDDCGVNLYDIHEYGYGLEQALWRALGSPRFLCIYCCERRLGRKLEAEDFSNALINQGDRKSERLKNRLQGWEYYEEPPGPRNPVISKVSLNKVSGGRKVLKSTSEEPGRFCVLDAANINWRLDVNGQWHRASNDPQQLFEDQSGMFWWDDIATAFQAINRSGDEGPWVRLVKSKGLWLA